MMQAQGRFSKVLDAFREANNYPQIASEIALARSDATQYEMYENMVRVLSRQQFADSAAALRELSQNAMDAYTLGDVDRKVHFTVEHEGGYTVLRSRDSGIGMSLAEIVEFLLVPFKGTKFKDPHKIGEHGIGWYSFLGVSRLVKVESKKRGSDRMAEVIVHESDRTLQALLHEQDGPCAGDASAGTTVTLYIPETQANFDEKSVWKNLCKYVGYVDKREAEIWFNGELINNLSEEYLTGNAADVKIDNRTEKLRMSFSKRVLGGNFKEERFDDERFDDRNRNLNQIVYTQAGLWIEYGSNPLDHQTIQGQLFADLTRMGLDFWIQLPRNVRLTAGRNHMVPEHANEVLEATYTAFRSLFLESIVTDDQILYHVSQVLEKGVSKLLGAKYLDHVRARMIGAYPAKRRLLAILIPPLQKTVVVCCKALKFVLALPFRILYYAVLFPFSFVVSLLGAIRRMSWRSAAKGLATAACLAAVIYGGYALYRYRAEHPGAPATQRSQAIEPPVETPPVAPPTTQQTPEKQAEPPSPKPFRADTRQQKQTPGPPDTEAPRPVRELQRAQGTVAPPPRPAAARLRDVLTRAWSAGRRGATWAVGAYQQTRAGYLDAQTWLEAHLNPLGGNAGNVAWILLAIATFIIPLSAAYYLSRALNAVLPLSAILRILGKVALAPLYPFFFAARAIRSVAARAFEESQRRIGLYNDIDAKKREAIAARREQIVLKFRSGLETSEFIHELFMKRILHATIIDSLPLDRNIWNMDVAKIPGEHVRISIDELIDLFIGEQLHSAACRDETVRPGHYFVDAQQPIVKQVMSIIIPMRREIRAKYDPVFLEDCLDAIKFTIAASLRLVYLASPLGWLHLLMSVVYKSIPNPYANSTTYRRIASLAKKAPAILTFVARLPVLCVMAAGAAAFWIIKALLYDAPIYGFKLLRWGARFLASRPGAIKRWRAERAVLRGQAAKQRELNRKTKQQEAQATLLEHRRRAAEKEERRRKKAAEKEAALQSARQARLARRNLKAEAKRLRSEEKRRLAIEKAAERLAGQRMRTERKQLARNAAKERRKQRQERWGARLGSFGFTGPGLSHALSAVASAAETIGAALLVIQRFVWMAVATIGRGVISALGWAMTIFGKWIIHLVTKDPGDRLAGTVIDANRLHRVVEHTRIGQNYELFLHAAREIDAMLSDCLQIRPLRLSFTYQPDNSAKDNRQLKESANDVIGQFGGSRKRPALTFPIDNYGLGGLIQQFDAMELTVYYVLLESLLHHKAHQHYGGTQRDQTFYRNKEALRAKFFDHALEHRIRFEEALNQAIRSRRRTGQIRDFVKVMEIARLSQMRIFGLLKERRRIEREYAR